MAFFTLHKLPLLQSRASSGRLFGSERQFQPELAHPRRSPGGKDLTEVSVCQRRIRVSENAVVQRVEELSAELKLEPLREREILEHGEIQVRHRRPSHDVDT